MAMSSNLSSLGRACGLGSGAQTSGTVATCSSSNIGTYYAGSTYTTVSYPSVEEVTELKETVDFLSHMIVLLAPTAQLKIMLLLPKTPEIVKTAIRERLKIPMDSQEGGL